MRRALGICGIVMAAGGAAAAVTTPAVAQAPAPPASSFATAALHLTVRNPSTFARPDQVIAIPWSAVTSVYPRTTQARAWSGTELVTQLLDTDADGTTDSLLVLVNLAPQETRSVAITAASGPAAFPARVALRHDPPRDDMAWESDRVAFRIYGEGLKRTPSAMSSSGIDVWQKRTRDLILERWYTKGHDAYHVDLGEGADFFDVGTTLGVGGTALWIGDTIHRADNFRAHRIIANGPIRAIFELDYAPWGAAGRQVTETKRFIIDAGQNLYRQESVFQAAGDAEVPYVTGVVKRPGMVATISSDQPWAWLTGWGPVARKNGGHGELGTAVMLPRARVRDWKEAHGHFLAVSYARPGIPVVHYIGAGWTASGDFPTPQSWWQHLDLLAQRLAEPVPVTIEPNRP